MLFVSMQEASSQGVSTPMLYQNTSVFPVVQNAMTLDLIDGFPKEDVSIKMFRKTPLLDEW